MKFTFSPGTDIVNNPIELMGDYGYGIFSMFRKDVLNMIGNEIVVMKKACDGYYDIMFKGGHTLHAISAHSIAMQPV
jgi:hypothetical protein